MFCIIDLNDEKYGQILLVNASIGNMLSDSTHTWVTRLYRVKPGTTRKGGETSLLPATITSTMARVEKRRTLLLSSCMLS